MKIKTLALVATLFAVGTISNASSSPVSQLANAQEKVVAEQKDVADASLDLALAPADSITEFQKFKNKSNEIIADNERRIADLKVKMKDEKKEAKASYEKKVNALERKNQELKKKLDEYKEDGKSDWKKFKKEFNHDLDGLGKAFKDITVRNTK